MSILVICNPVSGDRQGLQFAQQHVLPLLGDREYQLRETSHPGSAGNLAAEFLRTQQDNNSVVIVVIGGDGTIHEVVNGVGLPERPLQLVICPLGTANALYSTLFPLSPEGSPTVAYQLKSLDAFLKGRTRPLTLSQTHLLANDGRITKTMLGVVVMSTALHASILDTAEHMRSTIHGIERFKVAAAQNITKWYQSNVRLSAGAKIYDPESKTFRSLETRELDLQGPFTYFVSTVNVDRLEPLLQISPLFVKLPPGRGEMDLIIIRPLRDPSLECDSQDNRVAFSHTTASTIGAAYMQGNHINLRYQDGVPSVQDNSPFIVEYVRCVQWEWSPNEWEAGSHLVCVDGTILEIPKNGKATCEVLCNSAAAYYSVCA